jgi:hypothetical protein
MPVCAMVFPAPCWLCQAREGGDGMSKLPERKPHEREPLSPLTMAVLALVQGLLPALTAIIGGLWVAFTYLDHQKEARAEQQIQLQRDNRTRLLEARKGFIDKQLALYIETAQVAGKLVSTNTDVPKAEWTTTARRFEQLYWTELSMVEDETVKLAMEDFYKNVQWVSEQTAVVPLEKWHDIQQSSYRLARALRSSIEASWELNLDKERPAPPR